ncbi:Flp family type IVb pilin [uncultured Devosia sp.]|uniref:Flp family type IVb pilin n=1 Tax=uncultured Devosia sp. TaxID=211434 RepID=UPI002613C6F3|nr:Flp family type IVb pilin [uncultured Devosia sp.]
MQIQMLRRFIAEETGTTAIEYALLGTLIGVAMLATFTVFGNALGELFNSPAVDTLGSVANSL